MKWNKGAPPSVGWWPTKHYEKSSAGYRWWDGEAWSWVAFAHETAANAAHWAAKKETMNMGNIKWATRPKDWPERSRT